MKAVNLIAGILLIVGGLNWGLHLWDINLVSAIFGEGSLLAKLTYGLVGLSAVWEIFNCKSKSGCCAK